MLSSFRPVRPGPGCGPVFVPGPGPVPRCAPVFVPGPGLVPDRHAGRAHDRGCGRGP